ncbi:type II secretion system protein GspD [Planctomycetota bacterium]
MCINKGSKSKKLKGLFVWGMVLFLMMAIAIGEVAQGQIEVQQEGLPSVSDTGESVEETAVLEGGRIKRLTFEKDKSVKDGLRILGALYQKNIVPSAKVDGPLTVTRLYDVTFIQALEAILGPDFKYRQQDNFIKVYTAEEYKQIMEDPERMISKVFTLYYISAAEAMKLIAPVLSGKALMEVSSPANTTLSTGESISSGQTGGDSPASNDRMVVKDFPENISEAEKLIDEFDVRPKQVLVEATILSANLTEGMELGVNLNLLGGVALDGTSSTEQVGTTSSLLTTTTTPVQQLGAGIATGTPIEIAGFANVGGDGLRIGITTGDVAAFITALESVTDTTVLANPKILAVNKQLGQVYIGRKIGYRSQTTQTQTSTTESVDFLDTGTKLSFRPYIGDDGYIRMDIHPKDSSGSLNDQGLPDEDSTELATNIIVKDGQTVVIGGLFRDVVTTTRKQIPLLGDLPLIGGLFRSTTDSSQRQEVIVMLTPHIIENPGEVEGKARAEDISRKRFGAEDALQWIGRPSLAKEHYTKAAQYYLEGYNITALEELEEALRLRPTYLEALRFKEKILRETEPGQAEKMERKVRQEVEKEDVGKWLRN